MAMPDDPKSGSWRARRLESEGAGWVSAEPMPKPRVEKAPTLDEIRSTVRKLRGGARLHAILASIFAVGAVFAVLDEPARREGVVGVADDVNRWQIVVMAVGLVIVNIGLAVSKQRRASRLAVDPDADHPEAKIFE